MSGLSESVASTVVRDALVKDGAMVLKIHGHAMQAPGWPDLYVAHPTYGGWIEMKAGSTLTAAQAGIGVSLLSRGQPFLVLQASMSRGVVIVEPNGECKPACDVGRAIARAMGAVQRWSRADELTGAKLRAWSDEVLNEVRRAHAAGEWRWRVAQLVNEED